MRNHDGHQVRDLLRRLLFAEVKLAFNAENLPEDHDSVNVRVLHRLSLVAGQEAHVDAQLVNQLPIVLRGGDDDPQVVVHELPRVKSRRAEVDQHQPTRLFVVEEVRPVRVRLHAAQLEQFQQAQLHDHLGDVIALLDAEMNKKKFKTLSRLP